MVIRRSAIAPAVAMLIGLSALTATGAAEVHRADAQNVSRPNIVLVLTDDLSNNLVRSMPAVGQLKKDGSSFSRYYVVDSLCCPSRTAIFTGEYPHNDG